MVQQRLLETEPAPGLEMRGAARVNHRERGQKVDRGLVVADRRKHAGQHDLHRALFALIGMRRLFDMPDSPRGVPDDDSRIRALSFAANERVQSVWIGSVFRPPGAVEQVASAEVRRGFP